MHLPEPLRRHNRRGVALPMVLVMLLLCALAVLRVSHNLMLRESAVASAADYSRAFAAAEALMLDAETDVRGVRPDAAGGVLFPYRPEDLLRLQTMVGADPDLPCRDGICLPAGIDQLVFAKWPPDDVTTLAGQPKSFARYGEFTGSAAAPVNAGRNPYLTRNAWYWVEVFTYPAATDDATETSPYAPDPTWPYLFRITAVVLGRTPGVRAVLREVFVPSPMADNP